MHGRNVARLFDRLVARADRTPIPAPGCGDGHCRARVTGTDIRFQAQGQLLFKKPIPLIAPDGWNALALSLKAAAAGDATALSPALARSPADDNANGAPLAIECLDWPDPVHSLVDLDAAASARQDARAASGRGVADRGPSSLAASADRRRS